MKKYLFPLLASSFLLIGAGCTSSASIEPDYTSRSESNAPVQATIPTATEEPTGQRYTDAERGISFIVPPNWITSTDEGGNLYTYLQTPYSTVSFEVFTDKTKWSNAQTNVATGEGADILLKEETLTVGGLPTTMRLYQRNIGEKALFQYGKYYVDGGTQWYVIHTSDPSEDITHIIESVTFAQ